MATRSPSPAPVYRVGTEGILDAATMVFAAEGYDRANMDTIAAQAGITKPTLYARFGSKEGLFAAAVQREYDVRKARLFDAYSEGGEEPFRTRLHRWSSAYFDLVRERPAGFALITEGERHPGAAALVRQGNDEIVDRIAGLVVEVSGRRAWPGARLVASMISGIFTACAREAVASRMDLDAAAGLCESFVLGALRGVDPKLIEGLGVALPSV
jgi:AcrR family transcriptional regulator